MECKDPISIWIADLKQDDADAVGELWQRYYQRMVGLARRVLSTSQRTASDEEDVAASAFKSFYLRAKDGRFPRLDDRQDLWKLLMTITIRKAIRQSKKNSRQKTMGDVELLKSEIKNEPTPEMIASLRDELSRLLEILDDEKARNVALLSLENYTNTEIAEKCGVSKATVERKRKLIRETWQQEMGH